MYFILTREFISLHKEDISFIDFKKKIEKNKKMVPQGLEP